MIQINKNQLSILPNHHILSTQVAMCAASLLHDGDQALPLSYQIFEGGLVAVEAATMNHVEQGSSVDPLHREKWTHLLGCLCSRRETNPFGIVGKIHHHLSELSMGLE